MAPLRGLLSRTLSLARPSSRPLTTPASCLVLSPEVREALTNGEPVVSLEIQQTISSNHSLIPTKPETNNSASAVGIRVLRKKVSGRSWGVIPSGPVVIAV